MEQALVERIQLGKHIAGSELELVVERTLGTVHNSHKLVVTPLVAFSEI